MNTNTSTTPQARTSSSASISARAASYFGDKPLTQRLCLQFDAPAAASSAFFVIISPAGSLQTKHLHQGHVEVQKARAESKDDGVAKEIESLFEFIDANLIMSPIPSALTSEHIAKRVASLVASKPDDMLPVLTEIRFWNRKSLLDDDGLTAAFSAMLSPEIGAQLATGTEDERKEIVKRWLPAGDG